MEEWKPLVEWFGERYVSKNIRGMHVLSIFFFLALENFTGLPLLMTLASLVL